MGSINIGQEIIFDGMLLTYLVWLTMADSQGETISQKADLQGDDQSLSKGLAILEGETNTLRLLCSKE